MRFANLSQEATQHFWDKWKCTIQEILNEFNEDVFQGKGIIRRNTYSERPYLVLETKREYLYIFPLPGNLLILGVYHHKIPKEQLSSKFDGDKLGAENRIGWIGLQAEILEEHYKEDSDMFPYFLEKALKQLHKKYYIKLISS